MEYGSAEDRDISQTVDEELVGTGVIVVGDGVTATFDKENGAVEFYSDGGTLWSDWTDKAGIDRQGIVSIKVASGIVYLPADSSGYYKKDDRVCSLYVFPIYHEALEVVDELSESNRGAAWSGSSGK